MFGRSSKEQPEPTPEAGQVGNDARAPKGRPTPSRKEAEAARKQALKIPKDPKAAKKAARERDKAARAEARAGMMAGDERYLPNRDRGPVRAYVRDFVDSRYTLAEFFIFVAIGVIVLGFVKNPTIQFWVTGIFFVFVAAIVLDTAILLFQLTVRLRKLWPEKAERKGTLFYATLRSLQLRRLRTPPPRVKRGFSFGKNKG